MAAQALFGLIFALALTAAGELVRRRRGGARFGRPVRMFVLWWWGLGAAWATWATDALLVQVARGAGGVAAVIDFVLILAYFLIILMAFASLFYYLLFLYFGHEALASVVWGIYGVLALVVIGLFIAVNPVATFTVTGVNEAVFGEYQALADGLRIGLLLPVVLASLALFFMTRRVADAGQRYRLLLLSISLFAYLLMPLLFPSNPGLAPTSTWEWTREALNKGGLVVAVTAVFLAYKPPAWTGRFRGEEAR